MPCWWQTFHSHRPLLVTARFAFHLFDGHHHSFLMQICVSKSRHFFSFGMFPKAAAAFMKPTHSALAPMPSALPFFCRHFFCSVMLCMMCADAKGPQGLEIANRQCSCLFIIPDNSFFLHWMHFFDVTGGERFGMFPVLLKKLVMIGFFKPVWLLR